MSVILGGSVYAPVHIAHSRDHDAKYGKLGGGGDYKKIKSAFQAIATAENFSCT